MKTGHLKSYRFSTDAQWNACLFVGADREARRASQGIRPVAPYAGPGTLYKSSGGHAPAMTRAGDILWRDDHGGIYRLAACDDVPVKAIAPLALARAARVVPTSSGIWVVGDRPDSLQRFDESTLTRLLSVDVPDTRVIDIADGGHGSVLALVEKEGRWQSVHMSRRGHMAAPIEFEDISHAVGFVYLRRKQRFVVLAGDRHPRLYWFRAGGGPPLFSRAVAGILPCFEAHVLGSDGRDRVFLAGTEGAEFGGRACVAILDADGNSLGALPLGSQDAPATGITAMRNRLLVTGPRGLSRFAAEEVVPEGVGQVQCTLLTPSLDSPDREDRRRWLRIEVTAHLPEGSMLEIFHATTDDAHERDRLHALATDDSIPSSQRVERLLSELQPGRCRTEFASAAGAKGPAAQTFSAKLFDVRERYLWVGVTLTASSGAQLPYLSELAVYYPGRTLMEDLPAIYQREEERPDSFLRALVGVLETTTHGLDARIASMGNQIHPRTAQEPWLNFVARWLGVPWNDALSLAQKKAVIARAADLAKGRGTRAGLEALLVSLLPGTPRRFRIVDATADFGFALVGGETCRGSALPALLGGHTPWHAELDSRAVLGYTRLPCAGQREDGAWQLAGKIRIDVAATAAERRAWEPWLPELVAQMVPLTARGELHWVSAHTLRTHRLGDTLKLEPAPTPHLGTDAITNGAYLPQSAARLSTEGPIIGARLR